MPRYFFHVINGSFIPDDTGHECKDLDEAKAVAVRTAGSMLQDQAAAVWKTRHWDMFVTDDQNRTRLKLSFKAQDLSDPSS